MKKIGLLLGSVLIVFGAYMVYLFEYKDYDTKDAAVDEIAKEEYVIELEDGSKIILDQHGNLIRHVTGEDGTNKIEAFTKGLPSSQINDLAVASVNSDTEKTDQNQNETKADQTSKVKSIASTADKKQDSKVTVAKIRKKYDPAITDLEAQAHQNLDDLIDLAVSEYLEMDANNQKISYPYFYNKYTSAAANLEARTDKVFFAIMKVMEQDLKSHGLPTKITDSMTKKYEDKKNKLRRDILKQTAGL